jgi:hypothetical protein
VPTLFHKGLLALASAHKIENGDAIDLKIDETVDEKFERVGLR